MGNVSATHSDLSTPVFHLYCPDSLFQTYLIEPTYRLAKNLLQAGNVSWRLHMTAALYPFAGSTVFDVPNHRLTTVPNLNSFDANDLRTAVPKAAHRLNLGGKRIQ